MMGGSCSALRRRPRDRAVVAGRPRPREGRSLSSAVGRLCGSRDGSSDDDSTRAAAARGTTKRAARHSVDAEVPDRSISHLYPPADNYQPHPTDPTLRCPKSLTDLCIDAVCRGLPDLDGALPPHLPQDVVDRLVRSLTSRAALNPTTLRALNLHAQELYGWTLSLAHCRGVGDDWLLPLGLVGSHDSASGEGPPPQRGRCGFEQDQGDGRRSPPVRQFVVPGVAGAKRASPVMMDLEESVDSHPGDHPSGSPRDADDYFAASSESCSTTSFVSASSFSYSGGDDDTPPRLPSGMQSPAPSSCGWLNPSRGSSSAIGGNSPTLPTTPLKPSPPANTRNDYDNNASVLHTSDSVYGSTTNYTNACHAALEPVSSPASTLTLLDLRGSSRLTDRGLLQLARTPLCALEVVRLDNCHGITGRGLLAFSRSDGLHTLSLANCRRLTDEAVINVGHLGGLTALDLGGCRCLTDRSLANLAHLTELRKLDLSQCDLISDEGLVNLYDLKLIDELNFGWCRRISDEGLKILAEQPNRAQALRTLRLARCSITDAGLEYLEKLKHLEELDLNGCVNVSSERLGDALEKLVCLTSLDVSYCPGILHSSWQGKINALRSLELCYSSVRDSQLANLRDLPMLEELNLDSCLVGDWGVSHLVEVVPNLKTLDLADTEISDAAMFDISQLKHIRHLSLFYCNITNRGLRHIESMSNLEVLNLDSRDIGDGGIKHLRKLPLKSLDLFSSRVTGCVYLSEIKTLTSLELCGGGIGDPGCAHISTITSLTSLNLSQNELITNRGAASLAALVNLKALNLSNTAVNSDALKFFGGLLKLQSLALYGNNIVDSQRVSYLQNELPSLRCLRLNSTWNEDGMIDHNTADDVAFSEEEFDNDEQEEDEESTYYEEVDDESEFDDESEGSYHRLNSDSASSSDFQDAHDEESTNEGEDGSMEY